MNFQQFYLAENWEGLVPESKIQAYKDALKNGYYLHGRRDDNLDTGYVIQLTLQPDVAEQYAGKNGTTWAIKPKPDAKIFDANNKSNVNNVIEKLKDDYENGRLQSEIIDILEQNGEDGVDEILSSLADEMNPKDIVDSAGFWDNPELVEWFVNRTNYSFVQTNNGAVVSNLDDVNTKIIK